MNAKKKTPTNNHFSKTNIDSAYHICLILQSILQNQNLPVLRTEKSLSKEGKEF